MTEFQANQLAAALANFEAAFMDGKGKLERGLIPLARLVIILAKIQLGRASIIRP